MSHVCCTGQGKAETTEISSVCLPDTGSAQGNSDLNTLGLLVCFLWKTSKSRVNKAASMSREGHACSAA